jgi:transcription antitermination factor NusG
VPQPVDDREIEAIQTVVSSGLQAEPWPYLEIGQKIRIEQESLNGLEGILINFKGNHRIVVSVSLLRRSVALEIDRNLVQPVDERSKTALDAIGTHPLLQRVIA